ncbi:hypothetical protein AB205_0034120 [Aquarana catesbeiana]|uniref:RING-type E3 ubiquitin transferase n=1 Tax=Aquarana catesbeiana TaxID=8400 RepID=A0A2G9R6K9_AQUCT|nr:hypothetical protein AB205_0034120 [Aquarana catesbeiana]
MLLWRSVLARECWQSDRPIEAGLGIYLRSQFCFVFQTRMQEIKRTPVKHAWGAPAIEEEEGDTCTICFEPWTNAGQHRLSALRCGHLFGFTCIDRWLKGGANKCPQLIILSPVVTPAFSVLQCNKKAKRSDVVVLYARTLKALDTSEQERMKSSLELEHSLRKKAELESAQCRLQVQVLTDECGKLRKQIQELKKLIAQHGTSSSQLPSSSRAASSSLSSSQGQHKYNFEKAILINQPGNCRVMSYCEWLGCLVVSQPSSHSTLIPVVGRILLFQKSIPDVVCPFCSLLTNTVVQTYNAGRPVWSCCWCSDDTNYVYAGLINGSVLVYDLRDTSQYVKELTPQASRCPVVSLSYVPRAASEVFPCGGVLVGTLEGACFWEMKDAHYKPHLLPLELGGCTDIQMESSTRHCLVTYRPDVNPLGAGASQPFKGFQMSGEGIVYDHLWHSGSGSLVQKLQADQPVLDICPMEVNQTSLLATLTEKMISSSAILSLLQNTPYFMGVRKHVTTSHDTAFGPPNGRG